jgi:hypothetical protein
MLSQVETDSDAYRPRYADFLDEMAADLDEFVASGVLSRALELRRQTGQHFNHDQIPLYFTGNLDARVVLVHLNPKQVDDHSPRSRGPHLFSTFEEYFAAHRHFGARKYGRSSPRTHRSPFDHKQIRFLREFNVIDFVPEVSPNDRFTNLERVVDHKLQLELIPYGSASFSRNGFTKAILRPHYERIMKVVAAAPRDYVLFCGRVVDELFAEYVSERHEFWLTKNDGTPERARSHFANLALPFSGRVVSAGLCQSWARQGLPMAAYGREVVRLYRWQRPT